MVGVIERVLKCVGCRYVAAEVTFEVVGGVGLAAVIEGKGGWRVAEVGDGGEDADSPRDVPLRLELKAAA